jgi:hypothetical protein
LPTRAKNMSGPAGAKGVHSQAVVTRHLDIRTSAATKDNHWLLCYKRQLSRKRNDLFHTLARTSRTEPSSMPLQLNLLLVHCSCRCGCCQVVAVSYLCSSGS